jgi:polar amino acid transport system substrate-binding protein
MIKRVVGTMLSLFFLATDILAQPLTIYCEEDPPSQFRNPDDSLDGYVVELVREIQKRIHNDDPILMVSWARGYYAIQHAPNVLLFSMARTAERNPLFQWIGPILESQYGFFVKTDSKIVITSMDDAKRLGAIGVYRDDVRDLFMTKAGFTNLDRISDNDANIKKLMAGRIDAYAGSLSGLADVLKYTGFQMSDIKLAFVFLKLQSFIAASRGTSAGVIKAWNDTLNTMKADGTFKAILSKYYPGVPMPGPAVTAFN